MDEQQPQDNKPIPPPMPSAVNGEAASGKPKDSKKQTERATGDAGAGRKLSVEEKRKSMPVIKPIDIADENIRFVLLVLVFLCRVCYGEDKTLLTFDNHYRPERKSSLEPSPKQEQPTDESRAVNRRSLDAKRKSVEEKLNAVLERQRDVAEKLQRQTSQESSSSLKQPKEEDTEEAKSPSEDSSSRNDSLDNFSDDSAEGGKPVVAPKPIIVKENFEDTVDRPREILGPATPAVNVSVITSTPVKNNMVRSTSSDNVVVITGRFLLTKNISRDFFMKG